MVKHSGKILLGWLVFIMIIMGIPGNYFPKTPKLIELFSPDKIIHFVLFSILFILIYNYLSNIFSNLRVLNKYIIAFIFGTIYGGLTEFLQTSVFVGRDGNYVDWIADSLGLFFGILAIIIFQKLKSTK